MKVLTNELEIEITAILDAGVDFLYENKLFGKFYPLPYFKPLAMLSCVKIALE